jgi:hypothetical protein
MAKNTVEFQPPGPTDRMAVAFSKTCNRPLQKQCGSDDWESLLPKAPRGQKRKADLGTLAPLWTWSKNGRH